MKENIPESPEKGKPFLTEEPFKISEMFPIHPGDWPEDFDHENGNYICKCRECSHEFRGHKRRMICKICMQPDWESIAKMKKPESGLWAGCWSEGEMVGYAHCMITKVREANIAAEKANKRIEEVEKDRDQFAIEFAEHCFKESMHHGISIDFQLEKFKATRK